MTGDNAMRKHKAIEDTAQLQEWLFSTAKAQVENIRAEQNKTQAKGKKIIKIKK